MTLNYGSIHLERGTGSAMNFYGYWEVSYDYSKGNHIEAFPGDSRIGWSDGTVMRTVYIVDAVVKTTADAEALISGIDTLQQAGTAYTLELQIEAADYFEIDGSTTSIEVLVEKIERLQAVSQGYGTPKVYKIPFMVFKEAG